MARKPRVKFNENYYYHIFNRGNNKRSIFLDDEDKGYFLDKFHEYTASSQILIDRFCIMDNHFHLLLKPHKNSKIPKLIQRLCTSYSLYYNKKYGRVGHVFQDRYKSKQISTLQGLLNVRKYIDENPVTAKYCDKPEDYPWLFGEGLTPRGSVPLKSPPV